MADSIQIDHFLSKEERYKSLVPQIKALTANESNLVANLANIAAALKYSMGFFWVGFYRVDANAQELVLGPFQGPIACTRNALGKGVCGTAWKENKTIVVPDVHQFPGHIACSSESQSEIVVPVASKGTVHLVLDIDSNQLNDFDKTDEEYLGELSEYISTNLL
ncbi:MAG: GAF domain-containing protein [Cyclobacteriaceae bacterium]